MFFPRMRKSGKGFSQTRTLLVAGILLMGSTSWLVSEGTSPALKARPVKRTETRTRREKVAAEKTTGEKNTSEKNTDDADTRSTKSTPVRNRTSTGRTTSSQVAVKTDESGLKPGAMKEDADHPLNEAIELADESFKAAKSVRDYSATFVKREDIKGKVIEQSMALKLREKPFSVSLKFNSPYRGRQVVYVEGMNSGKLLVRPEGFKAIVGTLSFDPRSTDAMAENRYPITELGMASMARLTLVQWKSETKLSGIHNVQITEDKQTAGKLCDRIEVKRTKPVPGSTFHLTRLYIDRETKLPLRVENYGWPAKADRSPPLLEEYTYQDVRTNIGATDADFK